MPPLPLAEAHSACGFTRKSKEPTEICTRANARIRIHTRVYFGVEANWRFLALLCYLQRVLFFFFFLFFFFLRFSLWKACTACETSTESLFIEGNVTLSCFQGRALWFSCLSSDSSSVNENRRPKWAESCSLESETSNVLIIQVQCSKVIRSSNVSIVVSRTKEDGENGKNNFQVVGTGHRRVLCDLRSMGLCALGCYLISRFTTRTPIKPIIVRWWLSLFPLQFLLSSFS